MEYWQPREFLRGGIRLHTVVQDDPLEQGSVKLDTGEWVECACDDAADYFPLKGKDVLVATMLEDGKTYWFGVYNH